MNRRGRRPLLDDGASRRRRRAFAEKLANFVGERARVHRGRRRKSQGWNASAGRRLQTPQQVGFAFGCRRRQQHQRGHPLVDRFHGDRAGIGADQLMALQLTRDACERGALRTPGVDGEDQGHMSTRELIS
jgi:hypothetical protein